MRDLNQQQKRRRRSRYVRTQEHLPGFRAGPRDAEIVRYVHDFRFLTAAQLVALTGGYKTAVEKRLFKLWQHEYVTRRWGAAPDPLQKGPAVYQLAKKGADLLAQTAGMDPDKLDFSVRRNEVKQPFLQHALMISHIRTVFTVAARSRPGYRLHFWRHDQEVNDRVPIGDDPIYGGIRTSTWPVVPDGFFALEIPGGKGYHCMLEADRSTMDHRDFLRKLRAYFLWWKAGGHTAKFGIKHFVVLTVTLTPERAKNLFELSRQADDKRTGSALFWFTTLEKLSLTQPEQVLSQVWVTWDRGTPTRVAFQFR